MSSIVKLSKVLSLELQLIYYFKRIIQPNVSITTFWGRLHTKLKLIGLQLLDTLYHIW